MVYESLVSFATVRVSKRRVMIFSERFFYRNLVFVISKTALYLGISEIQRVWHRKGKEVREALAYERRQIRQPS